MPQQRRDATPAWLTAPARLSLDESDQLSPVFDYHVLTGKLLPQHPLQLSLAGQQHMPAMIRVPGELDLAEQPACTVDGGVGDPAAGRKRLRAEPALLEEFRCQRVDDQDPRRGRRAGPLVDEADRDPQAREFQGRRQPGETRADDQHWPDKAHLSSERPFPWPGTLPSGTRTLPRHLLTAHIRHGAARLRIRLLSRLRWAAPAGSRPTGRSAGTARARRRACA